MERTIVTLFETRRDADLAVEHLVQEHGVARTDIFIRAGGQSNSAGVKAAGADVESGHAPQKRGTPELGGEIEVSVDCHGRETEIVRKALEAAGSRSIKAR
ncbi:MAG: hypothetical protein ACK4JB_14945 [Reyranella sp.]